jgi:hypothetical protein
MFKCALLAIVFLAIGSNATNAQVSSASTFAGGTRFGQGGGEPGTIYSADSATLDGIEPLDFRMAAAEICFRNLLSTPKGGRSVGELFAEATNQLPTKKRVLINVVRVFSTTEPLCAAIHFFYIEE